MSAGFRAPPPLAGGGRGRVVLPAVFCLLYFVLPLDLCAEAVPSGKAAGWRGDGSGRYPDAMPPIEWDGEKKKNILWCTKTGPNKFSSPTVM
ncbi:MAG: hypothetical protein ABSE73_25860, partial [Planctomycetota bacterium]